MDEIKCPCGLRNYMEDEDCKKTNCNACCPLTEPQTNADRIRSMPIEEIADWLIQYRDDWGDYCAPNSEFYDTYEEAKEATIKWLQQPAEGGA